MYDLYSKTNEHVFLQLLWILLCFNNKKNVLILASLSEMCVLNPMFIVIFFLFFYSGDFFHKNKYTFEKKHLDFYFAFQYFCLLLA